MADTNTYDLFQKVEKWTTKEKFNKLDPRTIETGTEYNLAGQIDETDLASDLLAKINGKLTAPTTPTADSAVTMLADGTVGTKPLSEIGGGGKLYKHHITITFSDTNDSTLVYIVLDDTYNTNYRFVQLLERYDGDYIPATISVKGGQPVPASLYSNYSTTTLFAYISSSVVSLTTKNLESMTDTYVEL